MFADTRTNAGVDNIATFRKLHIFKDPGKRIMAIASAGSLHQPDGGERPDGRVTTIPKPASTKR